MWLYIAKLPNGTYEISKRPRDDAKEYYFMGAHVPLVEEALSSCIEFIGAEQKLGEILYNMALKEETRKALVKKYFWGVK